MCFRYYNSSWRHIMSRTGRLQNIGQEDSAQQRHIIKLKSYKHDTKAYQL